MTSVAIYARISSDPHGTSTATVRQERACRAFCESRGWDVAEVFEDHDVSAYRTGVVRPEFERLVREVGRFDGVVIWRLDRLCRRPADFERFWSSCERGGAFVASATEPIDSSSELGLVIVRLLVTFAQMESAAKSERLRAKAAEKAAAGHTPGRSAYGYSSDWQTIIPTEADVIRTAAERYAAGESLAVIASDLNAAGHRTRAGRPWIASRLRVLLGSRRHTGDRFFRGEWVATGCWPAIISRDLSDRVVARLAATEGPKEPVRRLLTGWLVCGVCGGRMTGRRRKEWNADYRCGDITHLSITGLPTEAFIRHVVDWRIRVLAGGETTPELPDWMSMSIPDQRRIIGEHLLRAVVRPTGERTPWAQERLDIEWLTPAPEPPAFRWQRSHLERVELASGELVDLAGAAARLGLVASRTGDLARTGVLPGRRIGRRWVFNLSDVEALAEERSLSPRQRRALDGSAAGDLLCRRGTVAHLHGPVSHWVYLSRVKGRARVHRACCEWCDHGRGTGRRNPANRAGEWLGPFDSADEARHVARAASTNARDCRSCRPLLRSERSVLGG